jgi:hypothetical protein
MDYDELERWTRVGYERGTGVVPEALEDVRRHFRPGTASASMLGNMRRVRRRRWHTQTMTSDGVTKQVDVAIAEFNALRAELVGGRGNQKNVAALALTAYGLLFTISFGKDGDVRLLLLVPPLGLVFSILHLAESAHINSIGRYVRVKLWPELMQLTEYPFSWEREYSKRSRPRAYGAAVATDGMVPLLLAGGAFAATVLYDQAVRGGPLALVQSGGLQRLAWLEIVEYLLVALTAGGALVFAGYVVGSDRQDTNDAHSPDKDTPASPRPGEPGSR